jgi:hypothetical protein
MYRIWVIVRFYRYLLYREMEQKQFSQIANFERDFQISDFVRKDPWDFKIFKFWESNSFIPGPQIKKVPPDLFTIEFAKKNFHLPIPSRNLNGRYPYYSNFQNSEWASLKKITEKVPYYRYQRRQRIFVSTFFAFRTIILSRNL